MSNPEHTFILTAVCPDTVGIVAAISGYLSEQGYFVESSNHFGDPDTETFFLRTQFTPTGDAFSRKAFTEGFTPIAEKFGMEWEVHNQNILPRVLIVASKHEHCVNDLLYRYRTGALRMSIPAIVSNHMDLASLAEWHKIPFFHVPITPDTKPEAEARLLEIIEDTQAELVVLARYMQVLSDSLCNRMPGRIINIHHSFLPGFKGARPYHKAHEHGVKLIGATAHYVSPELDEGPIIEQMVERVDHTHSIEELIHVGRDVESMTLARAVKLHIDHKVFLNGNKTVVFK
ncbi:MAG: formyltetrahydrofolate deformylase [Gammaproteobacteria bacterium]|nr:formyltetrahydrofolate deformylase [Gammaproteobacteria bacterium]